MKTQSEIQKAIVEINKAITKIGLIRNSKGLFNELLFTEAERADLEKLIQSKEAERNELSHAKRLLSRIERIQKLEADDRSLEQIAKEWRYHAEEMINKQEIRIKSAVISQDQKQVEIREATAFYHQEIKAINYIIE